MSHHHEGCCGGHNHSDHGSGHTCSCGCGGCSVGDTPRTGAEGNMREIFLTEGQAEFLTKMAQFAYLPLAQFSLISSQSDHLVSTALAPVYLESATQTLDEIKLVGGTLLELEELELLTLDYDTPLPNADYTLYEDSDAFALLKATVDESVHGGDALFDGCRIDVGSIALTPLGQAVIDQLEFL
ncbi:MAG: hypothetical protein R3Y07_05305 [Eubacteriales bacterium]